MQREPETLAEALTEIARLKAEIERRAAADVLLEQRLTALLSAMAPTGAATRLAGSAIVLLREAEIERDLVAALSAALPVQLREEEFGQ